MTDPVLLITGASSGIGAETARQAAAEGYRLVLAARRRERLEGLAEELEAGERVCTVRCDVTDETDQQAMVATALEQFGRIDAVFANAGMKGSPGGFSAADTAVWREMILTNVYGVGLTLRHTLAALRESRGYLLITGSVAERSRTAGNRSNANNWLGKTIDEAPDLYRLSDAKVHIDAKDPPLLFMTGEHDNPDRNAPSRADLKAAGVATGVKIYKDGKHGCWNQLPWFDDMVEDMDAFFRRQLGASE